MRFNPFVILRVQIARIKRGLMRESIPLMCFVPKIIPRKLFLDKAPSSLPDDVATRVDDHEC